jgi:hypothetical protein
MIVCSVCKKFVKHIHYWINGNDDIVGVEGWCKHCHKHVPCDWDCYEDVVGWPKE